MQAHSIIQKRSYLILQYGQATNKNIQELTQAREGQEKLLLPPLGFHCFLENSNSFTLPLKQDSRLEKLFKHLLNKQCCTKRLAVFCLSYTITTIQLSSFNKISQCHNYSVENYQLLQRTPLAMTGNFNSNIKLAIMQANELILLLVLWTIKLQEPFQ